MPSLDDLVDERIESKLAALRAVQLDTNQRLRALEQFALTAGQSPAPAPAPGPAPAPSPAPAPPPAQPASIAELVDAGFAASRYVLHAEARPGWMSHFSTRRAEGWDDARIKAEIAEIIERDGAAGMLQLRTGPILSGSGAFARTE